jgi:tryptophan synthase alpha chain
MVEEPGIERIAAAFDRAKPCAALIPYLTLGYPNPETSLSLAEAAINGGADLLELGVPFSDPLADGPVIQRASHTALQRGMTVARCLGLARNLRGRHSTVPFILMGYYNPILAYGERAFCDTCAQVGVDGLIVPDLPPEEGGELERVCHDRGLALIYLLAPTSPAQRVKLICERSRGFVYLVSVTGITGPRQKLPPDLTDFVGRVREVTDKPLAVGFGISTAAQAGQVASIADGVIVGSALVRMAEDQDAKEKIEAFTTQLHRAMATNHHLSNENPGRMGEESC